MKKNNRIWEILTHLNIALVTIAFLFVLALFEKASPQRRTAFDKIFGLDVRRFWDKDLIMYDYYLLIAILILSIIAYYIALKNENTENFSKYFLIIGSIAAIAISFYLVFFIMSFL